jgi:hypothetical protein
LKREKQNKGKKNFVTLFNELFEGTFTSFFKDKKTKKSQNCRTRNQGFPCYFFLMMEGSRSVKIDGSGSERSENI